MHPALPRWWVSSLPGLVLLGVVALTIAACDDEPAQNDPTCESSAGCLDDQGNPSGALCVEGACVPCENDPQCIADPDYAATLPLCIGGVCSACVEGVVGCACDASGACTNGECVAGACVDCDRGDLGCVCRANGTCTTGNVCDDTSELCVACTDGVEGCPCGEGESCGDGLICDAGTCVADTCVAGAVDCPCDGTSCATTDTYCSTDDGLCHLCSSDVPGCPCDPGDSCLGDNVCDTASGTCAACPESDKPASCACTDSSECATDLVCDDTEQTCRARLTCASGALSCGNFECLDGVGDAACSTDTCLEGFVYDAVADDCVASVRESCTDAADNPTAFALACEANGQVCATGLEGAVCVDTCTTLDCAAQNRDCTPAASASEDAVCGACAPGFIDDVEAPGTCVADASATCSTAPNEPTSIYTLCLGRNQLCVADASGAHCGECLSGHELEPDLNACVEVETCGSEICGDGEFCYYPQTGGAPFCEPRCADGQALDESTMTCTTCAVQCATGELHGTLVDGQCACASDVVCSYQYDGSGARCELSPCADGEARTVDGSCSVCNIQCGNDLGERTRIWPYKNRSGVCFCETQQGFYMPYGQSAVPVRCDADGDGWINQTAEATYDDASRVINSNVDVAVLSNFRCDRRLVDQTRLVNEYGQERHVALCSDGELHDWAPGSPPTACATAADRVELVLYEADAIDSDNAISLDSTSFPPYGSRKLMANEVNALTRACASIDGDYNANGTPDLQEAQPRLKSDLTGTDTSDEAFFFAALSYLTELHAGTYEAPTNFAEPGVYVIRERSRCATSDLAVTTEVGESYYWQACLRLRDVDYDYASGPQVGLDFARWSCSDYASGTCDLVDPAVLDTGDNLDSWSGRLDRIDDHDLCSLEAAGLLPLADEPWLGMNHHSQFRCKQITSSTGDHVLDRTLLSGSTTTTPQWDFNDCEVVATTQSGTQPAIPTFACSYLAGDEASVPTDSVGLVSARYVNDRPDYLRGCISEARGTIDGSVLDEEVGNGWARLCPGYLESPDAVAGAGNRGDYGKLICGCAKSNYGGENCELACASRVGSPANNPGGSPNLHLGASDLLVGSTTETLTDSLRAEYACGANGQDNYCQLYPPVPSAGFTGGRRGYWMCGEFTSTRPADPANPLPYFAGSYVDPNGTTVSVELDGNIRLVPVQRTELAASIKTCDDGTVVACATDCADLSTPTCSTLSLF